MKILFFGRLADRVGRELDHHIPAEGCSVAQLRRSLAAALPELADAFAERPTRVCVDQQLAGEAAWIRPGQEVAFVPPLSGG